MSQGENNQLDKLREENEQLRNKLNDLLSRREEKQAKREWIGKRLAGAWAGSKLRNSFLRLYKEIPEKNVSKETLADFSASLAWRLSRIGMFAMLAALLPAMILLVQTFMLNKQNKLLSKQNWRLDQQTHLIEAERRGSLVFVMSSLMDEMVKEKAQRGGILSEGLTARIISLTHSLRPYKFLEGDALIQQPLSPEKGQLFVNLMESDISRSSKEVILEKGNFSNTDLNGANIRLINLGSSQLENSRLTNARVFNSNFTNLDGVGIDFSGSWIESSSIKDSDISFASFKDCALLNANFSNSDLSKSDFANAILYKVDFSKANLQDVVFDNAIVENKDWLNNLVKSGVKGLNIKDYKLIDLKENSDIPMRVYARVKAFHGDKPLYKIVKK